MKLSEQTIVTIAEAVIANAKVLQTLLVSLDHEVKEAVAEKVVAAQVENVTPAPAPVATPEPAPVVVKAPEPAPISQAPTMPPLPFPTAPVAPAPVAAAPVVGTPVNPPAVGSPTPLPFNDQSGMTTWVMTKYRELGPKGAEIQNVLNGMGIKNINDVKPEMYATLVAGVEALAK